MYVLLIAKIIFINHYHTCSRKVTISLDTLFYKSAQVSRCKHPTSLIQSGNDVLFNNFPQNTLLTQRRKYIKWQISGQEVCDVNCRCFIYVSLPVVLVFLMLDSVMWFMHVSVRNTCQGLNFFCRILHLLTERLGESEQTD